MKELLERLKASGRVIVDDNHKWGYQLRFVNEDEYSFKFLVFVNCVHGSFHFHHFKKETFILLDGDLCIYRESVDVKVMGLEIGWKMTFEPNVAHEMWSPSGWAVLAEVATHDDDSDTYRLRQ